MFIAVINENFNVAEESKKGQQATDYWATRQPQTGDVPWMRRINPYRWVKAAPVSVRVENMPSDLVLPMQKALVQDYNMTGQEGRSVAVSLLLLLNIETSPHYVFSRSLQTLNVVPSTTHQNPSTCSSSSLRESRNLTIFPCPIYGKLVAIPMHLRIQTKKKQSVICKLSSAPLKSLPDLF